MIFCNGVLNLKLTKMIRHIKIFCLGISVCAILSSCEGPRGLAGQDANETCKQCHNKDAVIENIKAQWGESTHALGGNAAYANRAGCVQCHTSQGFLEYIAEGSTADISVPESPMQINCYTCHKIHDTYTTDDWELTNPEAQVLEVKYAGADVTWDKGNSNQCVFCHQSRNVSPAPTQGGADFQITNSRMGPHHGPNANLILGKTPFELSGTAYPATNPHSTAAGCLTCHMSTPYGYYAGGHNMGVWYDSHGTETMLKTGCTSCHTDATALTAKITTLQNDVTTKLTTLRGQLTAAGIYNASSGLAKTGTFKANAVLAYLNYNTVTEDRSKGLHNPGYVKALLDNSIAAMTALGY